MKIGLFGGSFNPIQNGHIRIAKKDLEKKLVDKVLLLPSKNHAFKGYLPDPEVRIDMMKLAIAREKNIEICYEEINREGVGYMYDTIMKLKKENPQDQFYLIVGEDIPLQIKKWYKHEQLLKEVELIVHKRTPSDISSTQVRENVRDRNPISHLVPKEVEQYINENGLYLK